MKHLLRSQQFDRSSLEKLFSSTDKIRKLFQKKSGRKKLKKELLGKLMFAIFYEPSTRTRISFASAGAHMGMRVITTENARDFSSAIKGETLEDTIRVLCEYHPDTIVLRHNETGAAERAASISERYRIPIINAGDGIGQHPTQALLDLYTIRRELGTIDGLTVVIGGDLAQGRTAKSLSYLLSKFDNIRIIFVSPPELRIGEDILDHLKEHGVRYTQKSDLGAVLPHADVVYWTRIQKERMGKKTFKKVNGLYRIGLQEVAKMKKKRSIILHPLPRVDEIAKEVDDDPRAAYFRQAGNGMFVRMAILKMLLHKK